MELTEVPDLYNFERKQVLAMKGLTEGFRKENVWADGIVLNVRTSLRRRTRREVL